MGARNQFQEPILELSSQATVALGWGGGRGRGISGAKWTVRPTDRDLPVSHTSWTYFSPPHPPEFLHIVFISKSFFFAKIFDNLILSIVCREFDRFLGFNFCLRLLEKLWFLNSFDRMSEIRSASTSRPNSQVVCPPLVQILNLATTVATGLGWLNKIGCNLDLIW